MTTKNQWLLRKTVMAYLATLILVLATMQVADAKRDTYPGPPGPAQPPPLPPPPCGCTCTCKGKGEGPVKVMENWLRGLFGMREFKGY